MTLSRCVLLCTVGALVHAGQSPSIVTKLMPVTFQGCPVFEPPSRGAFVCLLEGDAVIYCSVFCDRRYEFSSTPLNPYTCGAPTHFRWIDVTNKTHPELPKCTGLCICSQWSWHTNSLSCVVWGNWWHGAPVELVSLAELAHYTV